MEPEVVEYTINASDVVHHMPLPRITHGVCVDCQNRVLRELGEGR
jgi:hypothetical protein